MSTNRDTAIVDIYRYDVGVNAGFPKLLKLILSAHKHWIIKWEKDGVVEVLNLDCRNTPPATNFNPNGGYASLQGAVNEYNSRLILATVDKELGSGQENIRLYDYTGPYPKYVYVREGETETPEDLTNATIPDFITTETPEERAARRKKNNIVDWKMQATHIARHHFEVDNTEALANMYAKRNHVKPTVFIPTLNREVGTESAKMQRVVDIAKVHRMKLIGMLERIIKLYDNPNNATRFQLSRDTSWTSGKDYKKGDYEKKDDVTFWCLKDHTAETANAPGDENEVFWREVLLNNVPSSFTFDVVSYEGRERKTTPKNVTVDTTTGDGVLDYIRCISQEFNYNKNYPSYEQFPDYQHESDTIPNDPLYFFFGVIEKESLWKQKIDAYELWTSNLESKDPVAIIPDNKIYSSMVHPINKRDANQVSDALDHTQQDWVDLYSLYFNALKHHVHEDARSPWSRSPGLQ